MNYDETIRQMAELTDKANTARNDYMKHLLLIASAMLGAQLALYTKSDTPLAYPHILFAIALAALSAGILLIAFALFRFPAGQESLRQLYMARLIDELRSGKKKHYITSVPNKKHYMLAEKCGYMCFVISLALFVIYLFI